MFSVLLSLSLSLSLSDLVCVSLSVSRLFRAVKRVRLACVRTGSGGFLVGVLELSSYVFCPSRSLSLSLSL